MNNPNVLNGNYGPYEDEGIITISITPEPGGYFFFAIKVTSEKVTATITTRLIGITIHKREKMMPYNSTSINENKKLRIWIRSPKGNALKEYRDNNIDEIYRPKLRNEFQIDSEF